jgi:hypothetical protein
MSQKPSEGGDKPQLTLFRYLSQALPEGPCGEKIINLSLGSALREGWVCGVYNEPLCTPWGYHNAVTQVF